MGKCQARDRSERLADAIERIVVKFLLVQRVGRQAELQHGHARRVILDNDRRLDARRHERPDRVRGGNDLRYREIDVHAGLKVDLLDDDPFQRLRLDVLYSRHARADRILAIGRDADFHLLRAKPGILPDDRDDRNFNLREDVLGRGQDGGNAEENNQDCKNIESMRKTQREPNNTHDSTCTRIHALRCVNQRRKLWFTIGARHNVHGCHARPEREPQARAPASRSLRQPLVGSIAAGLQARCRNSSSPGSVRCHPRLLPFSHAPPAALQPSHERRTATPSVGNGSLPRRRVNTMSVNKGAPELSSAQDDT